LINSARGRVSLSPETQAALEADELGELLRLRLRSNALVVRVLDLIGSRESVTVDDVREELQTQLPHVDVADSTWSLYARQLAAWLDHAGLIYVEGERLATREFPAEEPLRVRAFSGARFVPGTFLPSVRPRLVVELVEDLRDRGEITRAAAYERWGHQTAPGLLRDAENLDLVVQSSDVIKPAIQAQILFRRTASVNELDVAQLALTKPNVRAVVEAAESGPLDSEAQQEIIENFGSTNWTPPTWRWRMGILRAWLVASGQVESGRGGVRRAATERDVLVSSEAE
jgi:hypothetical protein